LKTVPNPEQQAAIRLSLANPIPANGSMAIGYYAHPTLKGTPFAECGLLSAYAFQFADGGEHGDVD